MVKKYTILIPCTEEDEFYVQHARNDVYFHEYWDLLSEREKREAYEEAMEATKGGDL